MELVQAGQRKHEGDETARTPAWSTKTTASWSQILSLARRPSRKSGVFVDFGREESAFVLSHMLETGYGMQLREADLCDDHAIKGLVSE